MNKILCTRRRSANHSFVAGDVLCRRRASCHVFGAVVVLSGAGQLNRLVLRGRGWREPALLPDSCLF